MLTDDQLEQRKTMITASDAAAICGLSPYATAYDVYAAKVTGKSWKGNYRSRRGDFLEPLGIELLGARLSPMAVKASGDVTRAHRILTWLGATPDSIVFDASGKEVAVGEVKTAGVRAASAWDDESGDAIVPDHYLCQVQVQLTVCGLKRAHLVAMLDGEDEPRFYELEHSPDDEAAILEACDDFRRKYLEPRVPPPVDGSDASARMVRALFRRPTRDMLASTAETERLAREFMQARADEKAAEARKEAAQSALCAIIGPHEGVAGTNWRATWSHRAATIVQAHERAEHRSFDLRATGAKALKKGRAA